MPLLPHDSDDRSWVAERETFPTLSEEVEEIRRTLELFTSTRTVPDFLVSHQEEDEDQQQLHAHDQHEFFETEMAVSRRVDRSVDFTESPPQPNAPTRTSRAYSSNTSIDSLTANPWMTSNDTDIGSLSSAQQPDNNSRATSSSSTSRLNPPSHGSQPLSWLSHDPDRPYTYHSNRTFIPLRQPFTLPPFDFEDEEPPLGEPDEAIQTTLLRRVLQPRPDGPSRLLAEIRQTPRRTRLVTSLNNSVSYIRESNATSYRAANRYPAPPYLDDFPDDLSDTTVTPSSAVSLPASEGSNTGPLMARLQRLRDHPAVGSLQFNNTPGQGERLRRWERTERTLSELSFPEHLSARFKLMMSTSTSEQMELRSASYVRKGSRFKGRLVASPTRGVRDQYNLIPHLEQECALDLHIKGVDKEKNRVTVILQRSAGPELEVWEGEMLEGPFTPSRDSVKGGADNVYNLTNHWRKLYPSHTLNGNIIVNDEEETHIMSIHGEKPDYSSPSEMMKKARKEYVWMLLRNTFDRDILDELGIPIKQQQLLLSVRRSDGVTEGCLGKNKSDMMLVFMKPVEKTLRGAFPDISSI